MMALIRTALFTIGAAALALIFPDRIRTSAAIMIVPSGLRISWPRIPRNRSVDFLVCRV